MMNNKYFFILIIFSIFSLNVNGQNGDQNNRDAFFAYGKQKFIEFTSNNKIVPRQAQMYGINADISLQTIITNKGKVDSTWVVKVKMDTVVLPQIAREQWAETKEAFEKEAKRLILLTDGLWNYATSEGSPVGDTLILKIPFRSKQYQLNLQNRNKKYYRTWSYNVKFTDQLDPDRLIGFGLKELEEKKYYFAEKYFEEAVRYDPLSAKGHHHLGISRLHVNKRSLACESWQKALELGYKGEYLSNYCD